MNKGLSYGAAVLGAILILLALVLVFVVVPSQRVFPDDVDTTRVFNANYLYLLNADELVFEKYCPNAEAADFCDDEDTNITPDLHITRQVQVLETEGDYTLVCQELRFFADAEATDLVVEQYKLYVLDRGTLAAVGDGFPEGWIQVDAGAEIDCWSDPAAEAGTHPAYWEREGQVIGWPIEGTEQENYVGWSDDYRATVPLVYDKEEEHGGINTYKFTSESEPILIDDTHAAFIGLPSTILLPDLAQVLSSLDVEGVELSTTARLKLAQTIGAVTVEVTGVEPEESTGLLPAIPIPLIYYYEYDAEYWVEPTTGVLIDTHKVEIRTITFPPEIIEAFQASLEAENQDTEARNYVPPDILNTVLPIEVNTFEYSARETSMADAKADAEDAIGTLNLFGLYVPAALFVAGLVLLIFGFMSSRGGKDHGKPTSQSQGASSVH